MELSFAYKSYKKGCLVNKQLCQQYSVNDSIFRFKSRSRKNVIKSTHFAWIISNKYVREKILKQCKISLIEKL